MVSRALLAKMRERVSQGVVHKSTNSGQGLGCWAMRRRKKDVYISRKV
jgi:hypothetical protein